MKQRPVAKCPMSENALLMFSKAPVVGQVKTRLAAELGSELAAQLQQAFIRDIAQRFSQHSSIRPIHLVAVCAPNTDHPVFAEINRSGWALWQQGDGHLGVKLKRAIERAIENGIERIVIIGSDSPTLPIELVKMAFAALERTEIVIGPAFDGGYYLIGVNRQIDAPFERIDWGEPTVFKTTMTRIEEAGISCTVLPFWYDVDELDDLTFLARTMGSPGPYGQIDAPSTETLLARIERQSTK